MRAVPAEKKEKKMKKSVLIMLIALIVFGCVALTSCQTAKKSDVNYVILGIELKNKTEKTITELYIYDTGSKDAYNNIIEHMPEAVDGKWAGGKTKVYPMGFIIRPEAASYEAYLVFEDGSTMVVSDLELLTEDSDGRLPNEISFKPDPNDVKVKFDDDEIVQPSIDAAIAAGVPMDGWKPADL